MNFPGRRYNRKDVPRLERVSSWIILLLIAGIGVAINIKGHRFDPARFALDEKVFDSTGAAAPAAPAETGAAAIPGAAVAAAKPTAATTSAKAGSGLSDSSGVESGGEGEYGNGAASDAPAAPYEHRELDFAVAGLTPAGPTEFYTADTMYEKIDGRADQYLEFDVIGMSCRTFTLAADPEKFIDLYEFDMGKPLHSFGIYALELDPGGQPLDLAAAASAATPAVSVEEAFAYRSGASFFFRRAGRYYQLMSSEETPELATAAEALARAVAAATPADDAAIERRALLPAAGRAAGSLQYALRNAMSMDFLTDAFTAEYDHAGARFKFFIAAQADEAAAQGIYDKFIAHDKQFGVIKNEREVAGAKVFEAESFGVWDVVFRRGNVVGGVAQASDPAPVRQFVEEYLNGKIK